MGGRKQDNRVRSSLVNYGAMTGALVLNTDRRVVGMVATGNH